MSRLHVDIIKSLTLVETATSKALRLFYFMEIWKDVKGYEGLYQVSNFGNVKSLRFGKEKLIKGSKCTGYRIVQLHKKGNTKTFTVHKLVVQSFIGHTFKDYSAVIDHINGNKSDNRLDNLRIVSQRENVYRDRSKFLSNHKGVTYRKRTGKWIAQISILNKKYHIGVFQTEIEAAEAYNKKLKEIG